MVLKSIMLWLELWSDWGCKVSKSVLGLTPPVQQNKLFCLVGVTVD